MRTGKRSTSRLTWMLVLICVSLALLLGLAVAFGEDGDLGLPLCVDQGPSCAADDFSRALPAQETARPPFAASSARLGLSAPSLLAAVPGGLCLLN